MKVAYVLSKLKALGVEVAKRNRPNGAYPVYTALLNKYILSWYGLESGRVLGLKIQGENEQEDSQTDYFPGYYPDSLPSALNYGISRRVYIGKLYYLTVHIGSQCNPILQLVSIGRGTTQSRITCQVSRKEDRLLVELAWDWAAHEGSEGPLFDYIKDNPTGNERVERIRQVLLEGEG